uniref:Uncharacterized protein n=1 Tax=Lepeophtheirus salmonis TaxID=72036 RepID=A0A0K2V3J4_LEPSM
MGMMRILATTKKLPSVMALDGAVSKTTKAPPIWLLAVYRLTAADYMDIRRTRFLPWVKTTLTAGVTAVWRPCTHGKSGSEFSPE